MFPLFVGHEYLSDDASQEVYERANSTLRECSIWRTVTPEMDRWFILAIFPDPSVAEGFDWGNSIEVEPTPEQKQWMWKRRLDRAAMAFAAGASKLNETTHYEPENAPHIPGTPDDTL